MSLVIPVLSGPASVESDPMKNDRGAYEALCASLVGETLTSVAYHQLRGEGPGWDVPPFHVVTMGVALRFASGRAVLVEWGTSFAQHDIELSEGVRQSERIESFDVSSDAAWALLIGQEVRAVESIWEREGSLEWPQSILLAFPDACVLASAATYRPPGPVWKASDDVLICFGRQTAEAHGLLATPPGRLAQGRITMR